MAEDERPDTISREAHERVQTENASLKEQMAGKDDQLGVFAKVDSAYAHFSSKEGMPNPYGMARSAVNDIAVRGADPDALPEALDAWLATQSSMFATPAAATAEAEGEPAPPPAPPETPAIAGPNPAAEGKIPPAAVMTKEEYDALDFKGKKAAIASGRYILKGEHYQTLVESGAIQPQ